MAHLRLPVQLLPSAVRCRHSRASASSFHYSLTALGNAQWLSDQHPLYAEPTSMKIEQSNYSPNQADLRRSVQRNTSQLQQAFSRRDFLYKRTLKNKQALLCLFSVSGQRNLLVWAEWEETRPAMVRRTSHWALTLQPYTFKKHRPTTEQKRLKTFIQGEKKILNSYGKWHEPRLLFLQESQEMSLLKSGSKEEDNINFQFIFCLSQKLDHSGNAVSTHESKYKTRSV